MALRGQAIMALGLLILIITPVLRVAISIVAFAIQHDRIYVAITSLVLALLILSFAGSRGGISESSATRISFIGAADDCTQPSTALGDDAREQIIDHQCSDAAEQVVGQVALRIKEICCRGFEHSSLFAK